MEGVPLANGKEVIRIGLLSHELGGRETPGKINYFSSRG